MARASIYLVIFLVSINAGAVMLQTTGTDQVLGIDADIGGDQAVDQISNAADDPETGTGVGQTLFGMYNALGGVLAGILRIQPAMDMLWRAGVPPFGIGFFNSIIAVVIGVDIVSFVRGFNL